MDKITSAIEKGQPITLKSVTLPSNIEKLLDQIIEKILIKYQRLELLNGIMVCLKEITGNAKKANLKRVFFKKQGLDISDKAQYEEGMDRFKSEVMNNLELYYDLLDRLKYFIQITYQYSSEGVIITVSNNTPITDKELERIRKRYVKALDYDGAEEALMEILDDTEGAGLGIIMIVLMLKKLGASPKNFVINSRDGLTVARLAIQFKKLDQQMISKLAEEIFKEIQNLPPFPENIARIRDLLRNEEANISTISAIIKTDPSLTADLLKLSNSAQFMLPRKVSSIDEAIKIIGLRGLRAVIESYGTKVILDNRFGKMEALWQHAYRVAFYSQELAKNRRLDKMMLEDIFLGGLLHDLGKIVISSMHPDLQVRIRKVCIDKGLKGAVLEDLAMGVTHAKVGALLAEKWNFPDILVKAIEYHHDPIFADDENHPIVYTVYLANSFAMYEMGEFKIDQLDTNVLDFFNLKDEKDIITVASRLKMLYDRRKDAFDS